MYFSFFLYQLKHFSLPYNLFEACVAVFIMKSKISLRKISHFALFWCWFALGLNGRSMYVSGSWAETDQCLIERRWFDPLVSHLLSPKYLREWTKIVNYHVVFTVGSNLSLRLTKQFQNSGVSRWIAIVIKSNKLICYVVSPISTIWR